MNHNISNDNDSDCYCNDCNNHNDNDSKNNVKKKTTTLLKYDKHKDSQELALENMIISIR